ncbi:hypothetical protein C6A87_020820 [Mycobacterium sp. ITM-2016-00317]|uniref:hypothetical protein n=1 Tax=Mycobacterium sp. ITM-2016-00317 TaxID=2099694 RepID=UPI000D469588|nr:hypothetical protein [Mycobacterium sp. ITM-2016-00317]WNG86286.1 hypothetical protein C6A87_020820 [Mycobacterium sp. ITM-2016-00317]
MTVYSVLTIVLITVLATLTTLAIFLGLANWIGAFYIVRCSECRHLTFSSANRSQASCPHCRHPVLTHPIHAMHHRGARSDVRVARDRLRY